MDVLAEFDNIVGRAADAALAAMLASPESVYIHYGPPRAISGTPK